MAVFTRKQYAAAFNHNVFNVFRQNADSPLVLAFTKAREDDIIEVQTMSEADIMTLVYDDPTTGSNLEVPKSHKSLVRMFQSFIRFCSLKGDPVDTAWISITAEEFDKYCITEYTLNLIPTGPTSTTSTHPTSTSQSNPLTAFKRAMKRDVNLFHTLKDNMQWDQFQ
jgi:hypothetical protein